MDLINKIFNSLAFVIPALIAFNVVLSSVGAFFGAIHLNNAESFVGKVSGFVKKVIDLIQGNIAH